jgi:predicted nucleic acid-binding protein
MPPLIFDSTALIYLAKTSLLQLVGHLHDERLMPPTVHMEVITKGKEKGAPDATIIERLTAEGVIRVKEVRDTMFFDALRRNPRLHKADAEVIVLAKETGGIAIMDEEVARSVADVYEVENRGSVYILFRLLKAKLISTEQARGAIDQMISAGWRCSTALYVEIMKHLAEG